MKVIKIILIIQNLQFFSKFHVINEDICICYIYIIFIIYIYIYMHYVICILGTLVLIYWDLSVWAHILFFFHMYVFRNEVNSKFFKIPFMSHVKKNSNFILNPKYIWPFSFFSVFCFEPATLLSHDQLLDCCWGERPNHPMLTTAFSRCYCNLKVKKSLMRRLNLDVKTWLS